MTDTLPDGFMSVEDAASRLRVSEQTVRAAIKRNEIAAVKRFRKWWVSRASVEALMRIDERAA